MDETEKTNEGVFFDRLRAKYGILGEILAFLWAEKLWWMIPMVLVFALFAAVFLFSTSPAAPFVYTLF